nr:EOG090X03R5 [Artemia franciscana]
MKKILLVTVLILAVISCKDDENDIVKPNREYSPRVIQETYGNAKLVGFVNDKSGNPLADATVFFGEEKTTTGSDGSYQLNTLSAGANKRIWFEKDGYASNQMLADISENIPNRLDASLVSIDKTVIMTGDGRLIEGENFSVEIEPGGFVYSDGTPVEEDVIVEATAFLTSDDEFLNAFPGEFKGTKTDGTETVIESFGFIDIELSVETGEAVQMAEGVNATIKIKAPENAPSTIPMWHYDEDKAKWIEEGVGKLDEVFYTAVVSHFTRWSWAIPYWGRAYEETSKIIGKVVNNSGIPIEGANVIQRGLTINFRNSTKTDENGEFELLTTEYNESEIEAHFDVYGSTIISYTTSPNRGEYNDIGEIIIDVSIDNIVKPLITKNVIFITMNEKARIIGKYFGEEKRVDYRLLLNGIEVETTTWKDDLIEFNVPNGIADEGTIQIDRNGILSKEVKYEEGDWTCEIGGIMYDNNDLPISQGMFTLYLTGQSLKEIPNCVGNLENLEFLRFSFNQLTNLPESIGNLQNLKWLYLYNNELTIFPESISNITSLERIFFQNNELTNLPESIDKLQDLVYLRVDDDEKDIVSPDREYTPRVIQETYGNAKLVGFVNDKNGNPLVDVTVFFGEEKTTTGSDGSYQLNTLSAGANKRIWFEKEGYASTQKLADISEELPNRIDASLFPIGKSMKMTSDGGKIETENFSVEIEPGGFVYSDGTPVEEDVTVEATAFLATDDELLNAFPGEFRGTRTDGTITAIESFGFIDVELKVETGEPVQLADGVNATIKIKAPENAPNTIPMWHYDEDKAKWIEEGVGKLNEGFYSANVTHFTKWNWDRPYDETSKIVGRVIDSEGNPIEGASVVQRGITYRFKNSTKTNKDGEFELLTPESNESEIEAQFDIYGSTVINYTSSPTKGQTNEMGDIIIDISLDNVLPPFIIVDVLYITMDETVKIKGDYFGEQKRAGYKLILNGDEVETIKWKNDLIEFDVPMGIPEEGIIQIDRDGVLSREVSYEEGDWTCEIGGKVYNNNDLPFSNGMHYLSISYKDFDNIGNCFGNLRNLEWINISNTQLKNIPESIGDLQNLNTLHLAVNQITSIPESIGNLKELKLLNIGFNRLKFLPESIGNLMKLESLVVDNNQLGTLPESVGNLENIEVLISNNNQLNTIPKSIINLNKLREIDFSFNKINSLIEGIGNLRNLSKINIERNQLTALPESIGELLKLQELFLDENQLKTLPESIGNLMKLESLVVEKNQLSTLPESIGNLQNLQELYLNENKLTIIPESIGNQQNLKSLILAINQITTIPESIGSLQNLEWLDLAINNLTSLPESIGNLQNLEWLMLSNNQLASLPKSIGNLKELESLDLANNQLTFLPESIGSLKRLGGLELRNNQLTTLPESIKNLKESLGSISLSGNNFSEEEKAKIEGWLPNTTIYW